MLWEVAIRPAADEVDREARRVLAECRALGLTSIRECASGRSFLVQGEFDADGVDRIARDLLVDPLVETHVVRRLDAAGTTGSGRAADDDPGTVLTVLFKPGVTDNVAQSTQAALADLGRPAEAVSTCRSYRFGPEAAWNELDRAASRVLSNEAIEHVVWGPLALDRIDLGRPYEFRLETVALRSLSDDELVALSRSGQLHLSLAEMRTVRDHFASLDRDPTDAELETVAQTWSEHCSHKTLAGRIRYVDERGERTFSNMLKETIFAATRTIRERLGQDDWCVSVFEDNAGIVKFDDKHDVCIKVETHNHPSAIEPYGGANTGLGGVIRDPLGTGLGARPVCSTDVFCFAPPDVPHASLPPGVLHPKVVAQGVVAGVRDYGNRMGIPTVNGAVCFDERYLGNPLVYCGNVATIPVDRNRKRQRAGDLIVAVGGRTGRDGIHGATFSSTELTEESETISGGSVQIGNAVVEKMLADVILEARDRELFSAITDCGAGGFSSAVGEMGAEIGAVVHLDRAPLKYAGLSYTEIWISEAQERMVLAVPPESWEAFRDLCASEGVEATAIGEFRATGRLELFFEETRVADLSMEFLHDGRPPVVREARYEPPTVREAAVPRRERYDDDLRRILAAPDVCSKEWIVRQYDHEVQAGSVVKPLVGIAEDGPSDAAVVRPDLASWRGLVVGCGINPHYGDLDPGLMAAAVLDEAVRNVVAVGADPARIAVLDNFCWGSTERPETLGSLVRAALACRETAEAYGTPFVSGKDSLNNEFKYVAPDGTAKTVAIPATLLITALGQMPDVRKAVTMDLKEPGHALYLVGATRDELGGGHFLLVNGISGGRAPRVDLATAPRLFSAVHRAIDEGLVRSCHDPSEGGLAVALAEMAFAGGWGAEIALQPIALQDGLSNDATILFSESASRFLLEVPPQCADRLEVLFSGLPLVRLGTVARHDRLEIRGLSGTPVVDSRLDVLKQSWQATLAWD